MSHKKLSDARNDFKQMKGIGPKTERRLHEAGILTYEQLAQTEPDALAQIVEGLVGMSAERIIQEDWRGQARELAQQQKTPANGQHYATFTVELLLDPSNNVRRTRVVHVQDETHKETWAGWKDGRLVQFISEHAGLDEVAETEAANDVAETAASPTDAASANAHSSPQPQPARTSQTGLTMEPVDEKLMVFTQTEPPRPAQQPEVSQPVAAIAPKETSQQSTLVIADTQSVFAHGRSFDVRVQLDLSHLEHGENTPLSYRTSVFAVDIRGGSRQEIGTVHGSVTEMDDRFAIELPAQIRQPGTYRLEAETNIAWLPPASDLTAAAKGTLVHIY